MAGSAGQAHTLSGHSGLATHDRSSQQFGLSPQVAASHTPQATGLSGGLLGAASREPPRAKPRPTEPRAAMEYDIDRERDKIQAMEARYRQELEKLRADHHQDVGALEGKHQT